MTVGVVGYGHVGTKVVRILKVLGCRILVCDPYVQLSADDLKDGVEQVSLERIIADSDILTLHARVTEETRGFFGAEQFAAMKPGAYFVNTARGPLVDYAALTDALRSGRLRGAAIDVRRRTGALRLGAVATRQCDAHSAHRGRLDQDGQVRGTGRGRGGAAISSRRATDESLLIDVRAPRH
jgi:hypothetical protein